jgi:hypothetical protein
MSLRETAAIPLPAGEVARSAGEGKTSPNDSRAACKVVSLTHASRDLSRRERQKT